MQRELSATRLMFALKEGFIPVGICPFYRIMRREDNISKYDHVMMLQKFFNKNNLQLERLRINERDIALTYLRDYIFNRIKKET